MASRVGELALGASIPPRSRPRPLASEPLWLWALGSASAAVLVIYALWYSANEPEMDFQVYRMGGRHIFGSGLYSSEIEVLGRHLSFTYPPFAALLFWPLSHLSVFAGQILWDALNLVALIALIALSIPAARSRRILTSDWRASLLLVTPLALFLFPVRSDLALGQVNIVLILMIVADLATGLTWRGRSFPHGVLLGLAAAIKLTPLVFIPYLVVSRQWRAARNATVTFVLTTGAMCVVSPHASWLYFTKDAFDVQRVGNSLSVGNQALHAAIIRAHLSPGAVLFDLIEAVVLCVGIAIATVAFRRSSKLLAALVCAATGLLVSPISWPHHYVWIVPTVIWLAVGVDRPAGGAWWAVIAGLAFLVILPNAPAGAGPLWFVRDDAYVIANLAFIGLVGMMLWSRRDAHIGPQAGAADSSEPPPTSEPRYRTAAAASRRGATEEPARLDPIS